MFIQVGQIACLNLGNVLRGQGHLDRAVELWQEAKSLYEFSSQTRKVVLIEEQLASSMTHDLVV